MRFLHLFKFGLVVLGGQPPGAAGNREIPCCFCFGCRRVVRGLACGHKKRGLPGAAITAPGRPLNYLDGGFGTSCAVVRPKRRFLEPKPQDRGFHHAHDFRSSCTTRGLSGEKREAARGRHPVYDADRWMGDGREDRSVSGIVIRDRRVVPCIAAVVHEREFARKFRRPARRGTEQRYNIEEAMSRGWPDFSIRFSKNPAKPIRNSELFPQAVGRCGLSTGVGGSEEEGLRPLDGARGSRMGDMATPRPGLGVEDGAFSPALYFSPLSFQPACGGLTLLPLGIARKRSLHSLTRKVHLSPYFAVRSQRRSARSRRAECSPPPGVAADCRRRGRRGQNSKRKIPRMRPQ